MITLPLFALFGAFLADGAATPVKLKNESLRIQARRWGPNGTLPPEYANPVTITEDAYASLKMASGLLTKFKQQTKRLEELLANPGTPDTAKGTVQRAIAKSLEQERLAEDLIGSLRHEALRPKAASEESRT